ncbi:MAG: radical SAM protein [bacterium]|nr:radical SAM protein [bacterium]
MPKLKYTRKVQRQYSDRGQVFPNLSIAYLAALLEKLGHDVRITDANARGIGVEDTVRELRDHAPDVIGFNLLTEPFLESLDWIRPIKEAMRVPVIVGGFHLKLYPRETMTHRCIDYAVIGPGWKTMPELLAEIDGGGRNLDRVLGIAYRADGEVVLTAPREDPTTLDDVPFPARHLLPNDRYTTILTRHWPITVMLSGMGCPFRCLYCDMTGFHHLREPGKVVDEMEECVTRFGMREIFIQDETFTVNRRRVVAICEEIIRRRLRFDFAIRTRPDCVDRETLRIMKAAGCVRVNYGFEAADPEVSRRIKRNISIEQMHDAVRWAKEAGLMTLGFFVLGSPGETVESIRKNIALAVSLNTDYVSISKLVPVPNSELYELIKQRTGIDYWREFTLGDRDIIGRIAYYDSRVQGEELDRWLARAYRAFYFRPAFIARTLARVRSWRELYNLVTSAWSIF